MDDPAGRLAQHLAAIGPAAVAFSGGVDSSLLLAAARDALGAGGVLAVTAVAPYTARWELAAAEALARELGVRHRQVDLPLLDALRDNPPERCYLCKRELVGRLRATALSEGFAELLDGTNRDDLGDHRPGLRALAEQGVRSPLLECGLGKADVRRLSRMLGLGGAERPAFACLMTRLPHGTRVTEEALRRVEAAEQVLMGLGFAAVRVRSHGDLARIEVEPEERARLLAEAATVVPALEALGYRHVTVDLTGYRRGSLNAP